MKRLIEKYNHSGNVIFISSYPEKGARYSQKVCAVGGFTRNTVEALQSQSKNTKFIVLTVKINNKEEIYEENNILVCRILNRNSPFSYLSLLRSTLKFNKIENIVIEFEFGSFGGIYAVSTFLLLPIIFKLSGKKQILVLHQVVENLKDLGGHLGWITNDWREKVFNPVLRIFYKILVTLVDKVVVTEEIFKQNLEKIVGQTKKIEFIPHGVDNNLPIINKNESRRILNLPSNKFTVLYFGYLTWYKGADLFINYAKKIKNKQFLFLIAGGPSFTNSEKDHYHKYLRRFNSVPKNTLITGFVPEDKISLYYSAADLVVLPYRTMMSSSGPLSLAFSFGKPVILSEKLIPYLESEDFKNALRKSDLKKNDLFFSITKKNFADKLSNLNSLKLNKLLNFSNLMREKRDYSSIVNAYLPLINNQHQVVTNYDMKLMASQKITLVVPCKNEALALGSMLDKKPSYINEVIVVNNGSTDNTSIVARSYGAKVIDEEKNINGIGYGYAHQTGMRNASGDYIVAMDGDNTYPIEKIKDIAAYMLKNNLDFLSCARFPLINPKSMSPIRQLGIKILNITVSVLYGYKMNDILSGMWVMKRNCVEKLNLTAGDWNLSPEIKLAALTHPNINFAEYHIPYYVRLNGSSKQNIWRTGFNHLIFIFKYRFNLNKYILCTPVRIEEYKNLQYT